MSVQVREIAGWPDYEIHSDGRVWSKRRGKFLKPQNNSSGYKHVGLHANGISKPICVHRLVAQAFISNPEGKPQVNHKDGVKTNNDVTNLEWATRSENMRHAHASGLCDSPKGQVHYKAKLSESNVIEIRSRYAAGGVTQEALGLEFGLSRTGIAAIIQKKNWPHVA